MRKIFFLERILLFLSFTAPWAFYKFFFSLFWAQIFFELIIKKQSRTELQRDVVPIECWSELSTKTGFFFSFARFAFLFAVASSDFNSTRWLNSAEKKQTSRGKWLCFRSYRHYHSICAFGIESGQHRMDGNFMGFACLFLGRRQPVFVAAESWAFRNVYFRWLLCCLEMTEHH